jgi:hypothetical protein
LSRAAGPYRQLSVSITGPDEDRDDMAQAVTRDRLLVA